MFRKYINDNLIVSTGNLLVRAQTFVLMPIIIKNSNINTYGNFIIIISFFFLLTGISSFGIGTLYKRFFPTTNNVKRKQVLFYSQFVIHLIFVFCICIIIYFFDNFFKKVIFDDKISFNIIYPIIFFALNVIITQLSNYFRYSSKMLSYTISTTFTPYIVVIGIITSIFYFEINIDNLFLIHIFSYLVVILLISYNIIYDLGINLNIFKSYDFKKDIKLGFPLVLMFISTALVSTSDRYILLHFLSSKEVGEFSVAYSIGSLVLFFPMVIGVVLPPLLAKIEDGNLLLKKYDIILINIKFYLIISIPFVFGSYAIGDSIALIFSNLSTSMAIKYVIPLLSLSALFNGITVIFNEVLFVKLQTLKMFKILLVTIAVNISLNLLFFSYYNDIIFAAISSLIAFLICFILIKNEVKMKLFKIDLFYFILRIIFCSIIIFLLNIFLKSVFEMNFLNILFIVLISIIVYVMLIYFFKIIDFKYLKKILF